MSAGLLRILGAVAAALAICAGLAVCVGSCAQPLPPVTDAACTVLVIDASAPQGPGK